ncbi:MAG TPA: hypothetical protein VHL09_02285 [Dehalococcoidia bacterium]|nr:hypothetical protein [Dehalococcoidia bacterium]
MGIKVLRDAKARPYVAVVNGRLQRVRPKERYWLLAEQADAHRAGLPVRSSARAISPQSTGHAPADDEPPSSRGSQQKGVGCRVHHTDPRPAPFFFA